MTAHDAVHCLERSLASDATGRFTFVCGKTFVLVKLYGNRRLRFAARDKVVFRTDDECLTVEKAKTGAVERRVRWSEIECLAAGEPETDCGDLFQG